MKDEVNFQHLIKLKYLCLIYQVKEIEKQDSVLTPSQQIDRLTRPGATYFNLNPFDVGIEHV
jgi:hypothetical protein